jgi:hypothetical protein
MEPSAPHDATPAAAPSMGSALRALGWAILVLAGSAVLLLVADAVPGAVRNTARGVVRYDTTRDVEQAIGRRLPAPGYYPAALEWPPSDLRVYLGRTAAYWCRRRSDRTLALVVAVAPAEEHTVADQVLPPAVVLQDADGAVGGRGARVTRLRDADGALWQQVEWTGARGVVLARYRGTLDELMRIVSSLRE